MKKAAVALAVLLAALALVACGGSSDDNGSEAAPEKTAPAETGGGGKESASKGGGSEAAGGSTVKVEADPSGELAFTSDSLSAKTGKVTVDFSNPASVPHNVQIEDEGGTTVAGTETISESSESATANLKPGTYTFFCSVTGHREAGMEGTLTVK
jgi:plastocyanin